VGVASPLQLTAVTMTTQPFEIVDVTELAAVTGGQSANDACNGLVENLKGAIHDSYPHDSHDYAAKRMASFSPALAAAKETCLQRQRTDGDLPTKTGMPRG
jgi:hypothetical protein